MADFFARKKVSKDVELEQVSHELDPMDGWAFRGHKDEAMGLTTTLQLACDRFNIVLARAPYVERKLLREFGRRMHLYVRSDAEIPHPADTLEWISVMRHYGAPTRLLDWTYSIFVAAYFALTASDSDQPCWVWAINTKSLNEAANKKVVNLDKNATGGSDKAGAHFRQFFMANPPNVFVSTENPYRLNERLAVQRGVFLCPGDVTKSFQDNLTATGTVEAYQIEIAAAYRGQLGQMLHRLNIDKEVLFPGLQGLAEALRDRLPHLDKFVSDDRADASWIGRAMDDPKDGHHA